MGVRHGTDHQHLPRRLEQSCRYFTMPALSDERVQLNAAGQVESWLDTLLRDGSTHLVMRQLEFMQRPTALALRLRMRMSEWPDSRRSAAAAPGRTRV
jgi:hypothetical protein